jgi:hypothetical protein
LKLCAVSSNQLMTAHAHAPLLGAYALAPDDRRTEDAFYAGLRDLPQLGGLELPFTGTLHRDNEPWLLRQLAPHWQYVVTLLPGTMQQVAARPGWGLASTDEPGRQAALAFVRRAADAVARLNDHLGRQAVLAVEVHSAPSAQPSTPTAVQAFTDSLRQVQAFPWGGAELLVEHCDAFQPGHPHHKGFLPLRDELAAVAAVEASGGAPVGLVINWARSVLETHRVETATAHLHEARQHGRLRGICFSGCSGEATLYGSWHDSHMPHAWTPGTPHGAPGSLLTPGHLEAAARMCHGLPLLFTAAKIGIRPADAGVEARLATASELLQMIAGAWGAPATDGRPSRQTA